jgi:hypothetical protein
MKIVGTLLIVFGIVALVMGGITYTDRDTVVDLGPIEATTEERETIPLSPIIGIASIVGGIALLVMGARTRTRV